MLSLVLTPSPTRASASESASGGGGALRSSARTSAGRGLPQHACQPENQQFNAGGAALPLCSAGQTPVQNACYAPRARCADDVGFGANVPLLTYWLDRTIDPPPVSAAARKVDRGGFLDGARRKWGIDDPRTAEVLSLGFDHGVDEDVAP